MLKCRAKNPITLPIFGPMSTLGLSNFDLLPKFVFFQCQIEVEGKLCLQGSAGSSISLLKRTKLRPPEEDLIKRFSRGAISFKWFPCHFASRHFKQALSLGLQTQKFKIRGNIRDISDYEEFLVSVVRENNLSKM